MDSNTARNFAERSIPIGSGELRGLSDHCRSHAVQAEEQAGQKGDGVVLHDRIAFAHLVPGAVWLTTGKTAWHFQSR